MGIWDSTEASAVDADQGEGREGQDGGRDDGPRRRIVRPVGGIEGFGPQDRVVLLLFLVRRRPLQPIWPLHVEVTFCDFVLEQALAQARAQNVEFACDGHA